MELLQSKDSAGNSKWPKGGRGDPYQTPHAEANKTRPNGETREGEGVCQPYSICYPRAPDYSLVIYPLAEG